MFDCRHFLKTIALVPFSHGLTLPSAKAEPLASPLLDLPTQKSLDSLQAGFLELYRRQSATFKSDQGYTLAEVKREYLKALADMQRHLQAFGVTKIKTEPDLKTASAHLDEIDTKLGEKGLGCLLVIIAVSDGKYAINARLYSGGSADFKDQLQRLENMGMKDFKPVPVYSVRKAYTPDVRATESWPLRSDPNIYGQTISEQTGEVKRILIFEETIAARAEKTAENSQELTSMIIMNELGNAFFRQKIPDKLWDRKLTDQLNVRHLSEAFSDYCSLNACQGSLFISEAERIISSKNPNYLLSKALLARPLVELMKHKQIKDTQEVFKYLRSANPDQQQRFHHSVIQSFAENTWISATICGDFGEQHLLPAGQEAVTDSKPQR